MKKTSIISYPNQIKHPRGIKTKRAAIYIRCSSDEAKKEGYSPETQEEKLREFVRDNNWQLDERSVYKDIGCSGGTEKRPGLQKLLADAKNKEFDIILVFRLDRFFRKLRILENVLSELIKLGIGIKSISEPWADYSNPSARLSVQILGAVAEWQREITLGSRNEGMIKAMKEGKWLGPSPFGYDFNKETQKLEINKKEARIVRMIYKWLIEEKLSEYKIQQKMNMMKIPTKYDMIGKKKKTGSKNWWNRRTIGRILRNEIYTGTFYYRKRKYAGRVRGESNLRPEEDWIKVQDKNLKIVSSDLFKRTQQQLKKNKEMAPRNTKRSYSLQHKIICGFDGYHYQCATRCYSSKKRGARETKYYFCTGIRPYFTPKRCSAPTISESRILPPVWNKLKEVLTDPDLIMNELRDYINQKNKKNKSQEKLKNIEKALNSFETKRERYAELYAESSIDKSLFDKKMEECRKEEEGLTKEKERLSQFLLTDEERGKRIKSMKELYQQLKTSLENANYEIKREILQRLVEKVVKTGNKLEIEFNVPFAEKVFSPISGRLMDRKRMD